MITVKDILPKSIAIHACSKEKVYYMIKYKGRVSWKTIDQIDDCSNMVCFQNSETFGKDELKDIINCLRNRTPVQFDKYKVQNLPNDVDHLQISTIIPVIEDGKIWSDEIDWFYTEVVTNG